MSRPPLRPSSLALPVLGALLLIFALTLADAAWRSRSADDNIDRALIRELGLSDLALFTEARYTRHPTQADHHAAFQDHPAALEHFPSGSLLLPPLRNHSAISSAGNGSLNK